MVFLEIPNVPKGTVFAEKVTYITEVLCLVTYVQLFERALRVKATAYTVLA